jgi:hypothetical protein
LSDHDGAESVITIDRNAQSCYPLHRAQHARQRLLVHEGIDGAPFGNTISIPPTPLSPPRTGRGDPGSGGCCGCASIAVSLGLDPPNTPSGMNGAVTGACIIVAAAFLAARQLYNTLSEIR